MSDWQPISTAPKDGTPILGAVFWTDGNEWEIHEYEWCYVRQFFIRPYDEMPEEGNGPSRWMPLPSPPKAPTP